MTRKHSLVFILLAFAVPKLAQPTVADVSWPEARIGIDQLAASLAAAVGANDIGTNARRIRAYIERLKQPSR